MRLNFAQICKLEKLHGVSTNGVCHMMFWFHTTQKRSQRSAYNRRYLNLGKRTSNRNFGAEAAQNLILMF